MSKAAVLKRLEELAAEILSIRTTLAGEHEGEFPADRMHLVEKRICLLCGKSIPAKAMVKRGCHETCYKKSLDRINAGEITDDEAVSQGFLAPKKTPGRPAKETALDEYLDKRNAAGTAKDLANASEEITSDTRKKRSTSKRKE